MLKRLLPSVLIAVVAMTATQSRAQVPPQNAGTPEQQKMAEQMRDLQMKIMDNMQKQGVDPAQFFGSMFQQMQDGTFDVNELNQKLLDQGLIDADTLGKAQENMQKLTLDGIKRELGVTDDEWTVLSPKIQAYATAQARASIGVPGGGMGGITGAFAVNAGRNDLSIALHDLRVALHDKTATDDTLAEKLKAVRDARVKANSDLASAKKDLTDIITMRQEAILVRIGVMS
jgi:hypothetical protein